MKNKELECLIDRLGVEYEWAVRDNIPLDSASWGYEEGVLVSYNEMKLILDYIGELERKLKDQSDAAAIASFNKNNLPG